MRGAGPLEYSVYFEVWRHSSRRWIGRENDQGHAGGGLEECLQTPFGVMTPGFGFVSAARERRNTPCISSSCDAVTESKNKSAPQRDLKTLPSPLEQ